SCAADASLLLVFSAVLKNELFLESAGDWLKRSVSLAYEKCEQTHCAAFLDEVICEINKPMRNRKEKHNESED
ncbi:MAG: hypothetical protein IJZ81_01810, partial [Clostridia bacterium]|nr:hypothetical protein [Clostridia bacterium]